MTLEYKRIGDYSIPLLSLNEQDEYTIGFFGRRYKAYLKEKHKIIYYNLLTKQELLSHIRSIEEEANALYETLIEQLKAQEHITEQLKAEDPIKWIKMMNNITNRAQEIVLDQIIYH